MLTDTHLYLKDHVANAYLISILGGAIITMLWSFILHKAYATDQVRWPSIPLLLGVFERGLFTTFAIWVPSGLGPFLGTWIVVKAAGG
jgi:hypothetical protein